MKDTETDAVEQGGSLGRRNGESSRLESYVRGLLVLLALYIFIASVNMIGHGLKIVAKEPSGENFLHMLFGLIEGNPFMGLFVGLLVTSLVQSSSFTTSMTVGLVATGDVSLSAAIPIVMGANIGTSVTNLLVSMANVRRRLEFRRSLGGAIVHDFFNVLSVLLIFPLELAFGVISRPAGVVSEVLGHVRYFSDDPTKKIGFMKKAFNAVGDGSEKLFLDGLHLPPNWAGPIITILAVVLLFGALWLLVKMLQGMLQERLSGAFNRTLFRKPAIAFAVGILVTAAVQSSSVTTSLVVPLVGAGILKLRQIYPYTLGANIGTTITAILAALGLGKAPAMACAMAHLLFNVYGTVVFWPLQFIPISLAKGFAKLASRRRLVAVGYILVVFFVIPILAIVLMELWKKG
ncbi:MAG: Na/Pi symporter [Phycisphaerae bacterium]|nr:Na/Pi symporter [Phycisphaerae bacterium]